MRVFGLVAGFIGVLVLVMEVPFIGSRTGLWPVLMLLAIAVILLAYGQVRHGG